MCQSPNWHIEQDKVLPSKSSQSAHVTAGMEPILLQGHERSITKIMYNHKGDFLFTVAKDPTVNVWYSLNGERLGTYIGHTGAMWCVDADWDTKHVLTGSADNSCHLWDNKDMKQGSSWSYSRPIQLSRSVALTLEATSSCSP